MGPIVAWAPSSVLGFRHVDEALPPLKTRAVRAGLVALVWAVSLLPVALGFSRCTIAWIFKRPCPGCGMTRAIQLLQHGEVRASLDIHPFALLALAGNLGFVLTTIWMALRMGNPFYFWKSKLAVTVLAFMATSFLLSLVLFFARELGAMGGRVPV
jgi:hypothetical protein